MQIIFILICISLTKINEQIEWILFFILFLNLSMRNYLTTGYLLLSRAISRLEKICISIDIFVVTLTVTSASDLCFKFESISRTDFCKSFHSFSSIICVFMSECLIS